MHPLLSQLEQTCARQPDRPAACDQSLALGYKGFRAVAAGLAPQIAAQTEQSRVGIMAPTSSACAAAIFACWYAGKVPVPLNFLLGPEELAKIIRDAELDLVITIERFAPNLAGTGLRTLLLNTQTLVPGDTAAPDAEPRDVAVVLYTSGTSGDPKGVCLSFDNLVHNARASIEHARMNPAQVFLSVLPQFHSFGFTVMTVTPLVLGAAVHYLPRFSPVTVVSTIAERKVTLFMAIPSMYAALAQMKQVDRQAFASVTLAISGGEPLPPKVAQAFEDRFGIPIYEGYGLTETSPAVSINVPWARRPGSVGRPLPGIEIGAVDAAGTPLRAGQDGELLIRGHCVMLGYHNRPEATAATVRDGALWTGDIGHVDADGFVYITGRAKEMIIVGGENVYPREIESVLAEHAAVAEVAVVGMADEVRGELPLAYVILREETSASAAELRSFCRERLAGYKVPREVRIAADLPRSPTGKILKRALKR